MIPYEYAGDSKTRLTWHSIDELAREKRALVLPEDAGMVTPRDPSTFVMKSSFSFWIANVRGIPSVVDGFKPSQEGSLCVHERGAMKSQVAQLMAYCRKVDYHHGGVVLAKPSCMAQNYPGSNNINTHGAVWSVWHAFGGWKRQGCEQIHFHKAVRLDSKNLRCP